MTIDDRIARARNRGWVTAVLAIIWIAIICYAPSVSILLHAALGSRGGSGSLAIVVYGAPPVLLVSGLVIAAIGRRTVQTWIFASLIVLVTVAEGISLVVAR